MNRHQTLTVYGIAMVLTGIIISLLSSNPSRVIQYVVTAGLFLSSIFAFITSYKSRGDDVPLKYHAIQGLGLLAFAIAILVYATTLEKFLNATSYFLLFFGISEIVLSFQLSMIAQKINPQIILFRIIVGFMTAIGSVLILSTALINPDNALLGSGVAFIFGGVSFILFARLLKKLDTRGLVEPK